MAKFMTFKVIVRKAAAADMQDAAQWYEHQNQGLGSEYLRAVENSIAAISRNPQQYPAVYENVRRSLIRRFPFGIFYLVTSDSVVIIACLHGKRHPSTFKSRK